MKARLHRKFMRKKVVKRMAKKSGMEHIASAAQTAKALKDIIKAFMQGGWQAAAMQALKHYWPQILAVALVLLLLPVIIFCCLPAMLFGFGSSDGGTTASMNLQATTVKGYYSRYAAYCAARIEAIQNTVMGNGDSSKDDTVHEAPEDTEAYEVVLIGVPMEGNWFIALHSVAAGNDLNAMSEQSVRDFVEESIVYTVEDMPEESESEETVSSEETTSTTAESRHYDDTVHEPPSSENNHPSGSESEEETVPTKILTIRYLTPAEFMDYYAYSDADRNWAKLMVQTLQQETSAAE